MSNIRSDIFESFVKIALKEGLISEADHAEHKETDFHETNPRHDSLSIEQISKLYDTKPPAPKEMTYKRNIIEEAHPDMLVISPSYDKLNGLIENENQGQDIRIRITLKEPDGHLTQRKYAEKQLMLSLVRVANDLDNSEQEELAALADICLAQTAGGPLRKVAIAPLVYAIAAAIGALYVQQHMNFHSDGFNADYQKAISEIDDLLTSNSNFGVGVSYTPQFTQEMTKLKSDLGQIYEVVQKVLPIIQDVEKPRTSSENVREMSRIAQEPKTKAAQQALAVLNKVIAEYQPEIGAVIANFQKQSYKDEVVAQKGALTKAVDWTEILHGGKGLVSDDFDDVKRALVPLWKDIVGLQTSLQNAQKIQQDIISKAPEATETPAPEAPAEAAPQPSETDELEEAYKGFAGGQ